jgi:hypothetical protein
MPKSMQSPTKSLMAMISIIVALIAVSGLDASAQARPQTVRVTSAAAEVFSSPSNGEVVMSAAQGTVLEVLDTNADWFGVLLSRDPNGVRRLGWIRTRDVELVAADAKAPAASSGLFIPPTAEQVRAQQRGEQRDPKADEKRTSDEAAAEKRARQISERSVEPKNRNVAPDGRKAVTPAASRQPIGFRAFGTVDTNSLLAQNSFNAVLGTSHLTEFGGGVDVVNLWKSAFIRAAVARTSKRGDRAFVANGQVVSLGVPITISMTPVEIGGGWRFALRHTPHVVPYAGGGILVQSYSEKSTFAGSGDNTSQTNTGFTTFGGVEVDLSKWLMVGGEVQFRGVPNAIGNGSVSQDFGETNLGGFAVRVLFGIRH